MTEAVITEAVMAENGGMLTLGQAVGAGIVQGLTEFLPVSSTGHLILFHDQLNFTGPMAQTFAIFLHLGTILAVLLLYPQRFLGLLPGSRWAAPGFGGWTGLTKLFVTCLPAALAGFVLHDSIKAHLYTSSPVAAALIVGGLAIIYIERRPQPVTTASVEAISLKQCLGIGLFQCLALWPGVSRSASTIIGALLLGVERRAAAEFSFLVAVPLISGAVLFDLLKSYQLLSLAEFPVFAGGFVVSLITAVLAIKFFVGLLQRFTLEAFGWYRIVMGLIVLGTMW